MNCIKKFRLSPQEILRGVCPEYIEGLRMTWPGHVLTAVRGEYPCDLVLVDFIPTFQCQLVIFGNHKAWRQVSNEGKTLIQNKCDAIGAMAGSGDDLTLDSQFV